MLIEIWSDVVCPWCYIGKRRFEAALARFEHAAEVEVRWRSFELDPSAPKSVDVDNVTRLAGKYRVDREQAVAMLERVTRIAEDEGLHFRLDEARPGNTFDAHRLVHLGLDNGLQGEVKEALLAAYQLEGRAIADHEVLLEVGVAAGLEEADVRAVLEGETFAMDVRVDEEEGRMLGITGVPFFAFDRHLGVAGAEAADVLLDALEQAWAARSATRSASA